MTMYGDWDKVDLTLADLDKRLSRRIRSVMREAARELLRDWKQGIKTKQFGLEPNAPLTIETKDSSTPLVNHGDLLRNIRIHKIGESNDALFVGILRNAKTSDGDKLADIAELLEYGSDGPIVPKNGRYLSVPVTKKASRAGSPLNYPGHLIFLNDPRTEGAVFVDLVTEDIQYVLLTQTTIPPRPAKHKAVERFVVTLSKLLEKGFLEEVRYV